MSAYTDALEREAGMVGLSEDRRKAIAAELRRAKAEAGEEAAPEVETADAAPAPETATPKKAPAKR